jgi:eukaryotic-like serine/threonine-protein kinase
MVTLVMKPEGDEALSALSTVPVRSDPARTVALSASPELQQSGTANPFRTPERYQILAEHGRGGLGRVSRAHDRELGRDVAIKELISRNRLSEARFLREALITARLEHPGIVPVHEAGRWPDGTPFYAMKLVSGRPLRNLIAERKTVDQRIGLLHHVIAVADAIAYAHGRNIIHRDLKPANVIVGDFGETIVIDWGLAKDLAAADEPSPEGGPFRINPDADLTATGAIVGTPSYMAPEQERGDAVDQRADVFAIGAMLWELCSLHKVPPTNVRHRHRILRGAGIDHDLATIIDKALDPNPLRRYPNAGILAADLKAFKSGARISARTYSLPAMLAHWTRRHRALSASFAGAIAISTILTVLYVRRIATERDRADAAFRQAQTAINNASLEHAALLLRSDPTAALSAIGRYHGADTVRSAQIIAEARGRGVARPILDAHSDTIHLLAGLADGSIISIGEDRRITLTNNKVTDILADDVAAPAIAKYSSAGHLLAYSSTTKGAVLFDVITRRMRQLSPVASYAFAFASDGSRVASFDKHSTLTVWDTDARRSTPLWQRTIPIVGPLLFSDTERIVTSTSDGILLLSLRGQPDTRLAVSATTYDVSSELLVVGDKMGIASIFGIPDLRLLGSARTCRNSVTDVDIVSVKKVIIFACEEGSAGVATYDSTFAVREHFATQGAAFGISTSEDGHLAVILSDSNTAYIHDIDNQLTSHYGGHAASLSHARAPTATYPGILTGDINGTIRTWNVPESVAYVAIRSPTSLHRVAFSTDGQYIAAGSADGSIFVSRVSDRRQTTARGHTEFVEGTRFLPTGYLLTYGYDNRAVVWRLNDLSIVRTLEDHHSRISDADDVGHGSRILTVGEDGRLLSWSAIGDDLEVLFATSTPLRTVETLSMDQTAVVADAGGSVWHVVGANSATLIRKPNADLITLLRASPDGRLVAIGTERGELVVLDTSTWEVRQRVQMDGSLRQGRFARDGSYIAVVTERRIVQLIPLRASASTRWREVSLDARDIAFSPDGDVLGIVGADGGIWFYSLVNDKWIYTRDHYSLTSFGQFSPDGNLYVSTDSAGIAVVRDIRATFRRH